MTVEEADESNDPDRWLVARRREAERNECEWLLALGAFDAAQGWARDGQRSLIQWLRWKFKMATSTCYEKQHVATQLRDRPVLAEAFGDGRISYSAVRIIARMDDPDVATDTAVVAAAEHLTVRQLEQLVTHYELLADQERPPPDLDRRRGVRKRPLGDGWAKVEATLPEVEADEFLTALEAFAAAARRSAPSAHAEDADPAGDDGPFADGGGHDPACSTHAEDTGEAPDPVGPSEGSREGSARAEDEDRVRVWRASRADGLLGLARVALAHADDGGAAGDDRYLLHLVDRGGQVTRLDGTPLDPATAQMIACDSSIVSHTTDDAGEPLHLGRKTRVWSTAQRRAVLVRDGGHCRFPGCESRHIDVHHRIAWEDDGPTDIDNALAICRHHHRLLHHGFTTSTGAAGAVHFHRPDGTTIDTTHPVRSSGQLPFAA